MTSSLLRALRGETVSPPPVWFMRQAGRYLPEYREIRKKAPSFLDFCYNPELAVEATLQPIRRFGFDAAILFSDILVVPDGLGQKVWFVEGEGPRLEPIGTGDLSGLSAERVREHLAPVYETVAAIRAALPAETALIGFTGAPWTLATYMIGGRGGGDHFPARKASMADPEGFARLIDLLVEACSIHAIAQVEAGAEVIQIFDSWAGSLDEEGFGRWSAAPIAAITRRIREVAPHVPVIGFPRGAGTLTEGFVETTGVDAVSLDWSYAYAAGRSLQERVTIQGNLDPARLVAGGPQLLAAVDRILDAFASGPFVFNLGHGISLETPVENVEATLERIRSRA